MRIIIFKTLAIIPIFYPHRRIDRGRYKSTTIDCRQFGVIIFYCFFVGRRLLHQLELAGAVRVSPYREQRRFGRAVTAITRSPLTLHHVAVQIDQIIVRRTSNFGLVRYIDRVLDLVSARSEAPIWQTD
ncbi:MAG: hypothetical protein BGN95_21900 [Sphingomonas sp. 66-10]|nr:MAG: hypothetical protein BGN95_21900 [Sphingomonas sp. 66-10]